MLRRRGVQVRVGIFVFATLVALMVAIFVLGSRTQYFQAQYSLRAVFSNVGGLLEGAGVYLAGVQVGRVGEIRFFEDKAAQKVLVVLKIARRVQDRIRQDSIASIATAGLLGDKYIDITLGSTSEPVLEDGTLIRGQEPADYSQFLRKGETILENVMEITTSLASITSSYRGSRTPTAAADLLTSLSNIAKAIETGDGLIHSLLYEKGNTQIFADIAATTKGLREVTAGITQGKGFLHTLLTDPNPEMVVRLTKVLASLQNLLQDVEKGQGVLHALVHDKQGGKAVEDVAKAARSTQELLASLQGQQGLLGDPKQKPMFTELAQTIHELHQVAADVAEGRGTIGGLLRDPTLYENLTALIEGARRSWLLRTVIESTVSKGKDRER